MPPIDPFQRFNVQSLYHFTDRRNLPNIRANGGLFSLAELRRRSITVPAPGGNQLSQDLDGAAGMDQYVHLCLSREHPMAHVARQAGHIQEVVFLEIDSAVRHWPGVMYVPGVSNSSGMIPVPIMGALNTIDLEVLHTFIDWKTVPGAYARRQAAEKCEVLVPNHIPVQFIRNMPNG